MASSFPSSATMNDDCVVFDGYWTTNGTPGLMFGKGCRLVKIKSTGKIMTWNKLNLNNHKQNMSSTSSQMDSLFNSGSDESSQSVTHPRNWHNDQQENDSKQLLTGSLPPLLAQGRGHAFSATLPQNMGPRNLSTSSASPAYTNQPPSITSRLLVTAQSGHQSEDTQVHSIRRKQLPTSSKDHPIEKDFRNHSHKLQVNSEDIVSQRLSSKGRLSPLQESQANNIPDLSRDDCILAVQKTRSTACRVNTRRESAQHPSKLFENVPASSTRDSSLHSSLFPASSFSNHLKSPPGFLGRYRTISTPELLSPKGPKSASQPLQYRSVSFSSLRDSKPNPASFLRIDIDNLNILLDTSPDSPFICASNSSAISLSQITKIPLLVPSSIFHMSERPVFLPESGWTSLPSIHKPPSRSEMANFSQRPQTPTPPQSSEGSPDDQLKAPILATKAKTKVASSDCIEESPVEGPSTIGANATINGSFHGGETTVNASSSTTPISFSPQDKIAMRPLPRFPLFDSGRKSIVHGSDPFVTSSDIFSASGTESSPMSYESLQHHPPVIGRVADIESPMLRLVALDQARRASEAASERRKRGWSASRVANHGSESSGDADDEGPVQRLAAAGLPRPREPTPHRFHRFDGPSEYDGKRSGWWGFLGLGACCGCGEEYIDDASY